MSPVIVVVEHAEAPAPWRERLRTRYRGHPRVWNVILVAASVGALAAWVQIYANWPKTASVAFGAAGLVWLILKEVFDKPARKLAGLMHSTWWLSVPMLIALLWVVSLAALPPIERNQVVVVPGDTLAETVKYEAGWRLRVLQNEKTVCKIPNYDGQILVCGGANTEAITAPEPVLQPFATRWKGGDEVLVKCTDPKALENRREYNCGRSRFPNSATKLSLEVKIHEN